MPVTQEVVSLVVVELSFVDVVFEVVVTSFVVVFLLSSFALFFLVPHYTNVAAVTMPANKLNIIFFFFII